MKGHSMLQFCFAINTVSIKPGKPWFILRFFVLVIFGGFMGNFMGQFLGINGNLGSYLLNNRGSSSHSVSLYRLKTGKDLIQG